MSLLQALVISALLAFSSGAWSASAGVSAHRDPNLSYKNYTFMVAHYLREMGLGFDSPLNRGVPYKDVRKEEITEWPSEEIVQLGFNRMRDERFVNDGQHVDFLRRSSWLYPDDGCFARAELARNSLVSWQYGEPSKVFVFGDLRVNTTNSPDGYVTWWYHVIPVVRVGEKVFALDPAIEPKRALLIEEWLAAMHSTWQTSVNVAVCKGASYTPHSSCLTPDDSRERAQFDQLMYLSYEWDRQVELKREPLQVLGENPPWRQ